MSILDAVPQTTGIWRTLAAAGISLEVFAARGRSPRPLAVVTAGVHGDEYEGPTALADFIRTLDATRLRGSLIAVPVVNPSAFAAGTRTSPEDGLNLARCFPGNPGGSFTERLAATVFADLVAGADFLIDLHSGGVAYDFVPVAGFYGPASADNPSLQAAAAFGLETLWQLPGTGGVLSCEAGKRGTVAIGCEYRGGGRLDPLGRRRYREGIDRCLRAWGVLEGDPVPSTSPRVFTGRWQLTDADGVFVAARELGQTVQPGDLLATIEDQRGNSVREFRAEAAGVVLGLRCKAGIRAGEWSVFLGMPVMSGG